MRSYFPIVRWVLVAQAAAALYRGELIKLLLAVVFFGIVFSLPGLRADALLGGFVFTLSVFWFALLVRSKNL